MSEAMVAVEIPLAACVASEHQQRDDMGDIDALARNIETVGQLTPILVVADGARYQIVAGHRRVAALKALGRETAQAFVFSGWDDAQITRVLFAENTCRKDMSYDERCRGVQEMLQLGDTSEAASACTDVSLAQVENYRIGRRHLGCLAGEAGEQVSFGRLEAIGKADHEGIVPAEVIADAMACANDWEAGRMVAEAAAEAKARSLVAQLNEGMDTPMAVLKADAGDMIEGAYRLDDAACEHAEAFMVVSPNRFNESYEPDCAWYCPDESHASTKPEREQWEINAERTERAIEAGFKELVADANTWVAELMAEDNRCVYAIADTRLMERCMRYLNNLLRSHYKSCGERCLGDILPGVGSSAAGHAAAADERVYELALTTVFPLDGDSYYMLSDNSSSAPWYCSADAAANAVEGHVNEWSVKRHAAYLGDLLDFIGELDDAGCTPGKAVDVMVACLEDARTCMEKACAGEVE